MPNVFAEYVIFNGMLRGITITVWSSVSTIWWTVDALLTTLIHSPSVSVTTWAPSFNSPQVAVDITVGEPPLLWLAI